jgi:hypothetical protein
MAKSIMRRLDVFVAEIDQKVIVGSLRCLAEARGERIMEKRGKRREAEERRIPRNEPLRVQPMQWQDKNQAQEERSQRR